MRCSWSVSNCFTDFCVSANKNIWITICTILISAIKVFNFSTSKLLPPLLLITFNQFYLLWSLHWPFFIRINPNVPQQNVVEQNHHFFCEFTATRQYKPGVAKTSTTRPVEVVGDAGYDFVIFSIMILIYGIRDCSKYWMTLTLYQGQSLLRKVILKIPY